MADPMHILTQVDDAMSEHYDLEAVVIESRFGNTAAHIDRTSSFKGASMHKKFYDQQFSRVIANDDIEGDLPSAGRLQAIDMEIQTSHLRSLDFQVDVSFAALDLCTDAQAAWDLGTELFLQAEQAVGEKRNSMLHMNADMVLAQVKGSILDEDGTSYTSGDDQTDAFIPVDTGSISNFKRGQIIDIREGSDNTSVRVTCEVITVWHDEYFEGSAVGPGILVEIADENDGDANLDNVADNDEICAVGETDVNYHAAFQSLFALSSPGAYFGKTRTTAANRFLQPYGRSYSDAELDVEQHFGKMADTIGMMLPASRKQRRVRNLNGKFQMTDAVVAICQPSLLNEAARQCGEPNAFMTRSTARSESAAKGTKLVAVHGWDGVVLRHPNLPPIALQADPQCAPNRIYLIEPNTWEWIRQGSDGMKPTWVPGTVKGTRWHQMYTSGGNISKKYVAGGYVHEAPFCDQPQLNYLIDGVTSSI